MSAIQFESTIKAFNQSSLGAYIYICRLSTAQSLHIFENGGLPQPWTAATCSWKSNWKTTCKTCKTLRSIRICGGCVRGRHNRGRGGNRRVSVSDEIKATLVDHVINRGFTMEEAGRRVLPNVNWSTVSSIVPTFHRENRQICISFFVLQYVKHFYKQQYWKGKCKFICTFYRTAQQPRAGGREAVFNHQQEQEMCYIVIANNSIRLREIQIAIIMSSQI